MRIAIIGGLGFIGREFSKYAFNRGHIIDVYDMIEYEVSNEDVFNYYPIDLASDSPSGLSKADAMIILAAKRPYTGFSFTDYENNVRIAEKCFELAKRNNIKNLVFASSKAVYSEQKTIPWNENTYTTPLSLYGASKVAVEQLSLWHNENNELNIKCLRFAQVIGMGERKGYLINTLIDNAMEKKQQVVFGDGSQKRQYIYIKDVCKAILTALEHSEMKGVFNIGMPGAVSNLELAECVNKVFDNVGNLVCDLSKPMGDFCDEMDVKKAELLLGYKTSYNIQTLFEDLAGAE